MKKLASLSVLTLAIMPTVFAANPFSDVEANHWSYQALEELQSKGILEGYPDGSFKGSQPITRYEMAQALAKAMVHSDKANAEDQALINRLAQEYGQELSNLGVRINQLEDRVGTIKMTGDLRLRYLGSDKPTGAIPGYAYALGHQSYFDMRTRLKAIAQVNDKTSVGLRMNGSSEFGSASSASNLWFDQAYVKHQLVKHTSVTAGRYEQRIGNGLSYWDSFDGIQVHSGRQKFNVELAYGQMVTDGFKKLTAKENPHLALLNLQGKVTKDIKLGGFLAHIEDGQVRRYNDTTSKANRIAIPSDSYYGLSMDYDHGRWWAGGEWLRGKSTDKTHTWTAGASYGTYSAAKLKQGTWLGKLQYISEEQYSPVITSAYAFAYDLSTPRMSQYDGYKGWMATGRYVPWNNAVISAFYGFDSKDQSGRKLPNYYRAELNVRF